MRPYINQCSSVDCGILCAMVLPICPAACESPAQVHLSSGCFLEFSAEAARARAQDLRVGHKEAVPIDPFWVFEIKGNPSCLPIASEHQVVVSALRASAPHTVLVVLGRRVRSRRGACPLDALWLRPGSGQPTIQLPVGNAAL